MDGAMRVERGMFSPPRIRSLVAKVRQRILPLANRAARWYGNIKISRPSAGLASDLIPPVGIIVGAVAFGFWWSSLAAGLFACFGLFFLAGIYKATGRIVAAVLRWEGDRVAGTADWDAALGDQSHRSVEAVAAIEKLKSWVANETSPTEEDVKASCAVLLQSVALRNNQ